jgi:hypothetical protein
LREYALEQQRLPEIENDRNLDLSQTFYGVDEQGRKNRSDLLLSLMRGGYTTDRGNMVSVTEPHGLGDVLQELLGTDETTLRSIFKSMIIL